MNALASCNNYRKISIILLAVFIIISYFPKHVFAGIEPNFFNFRMMPFFWFCFLISYFRFVPRIHPVGRLSMLEMIYLEAIVCAVIFIAIPFLLGSMIGEMGESPYDHTITGMTNNLLFIIPPIAAREIVRSYFLGFFCSKANVRAFLFITAVMILLNVNYIEWETLHGLHDFTVYFAEDIGPLICQQIMLSYLALYGGSTASIIYILIITVFEWVSPILPVLNWLTKGAAGILVPIFSLSFIIKKYENKVNNVKDKKTSPLEALKWSVTALFSIGLIWFVIGVFPIVPSVVATGSMEPLFYPGDVILLEQIREENQIFSLKKGDIIQFQRGKIRITHRIIEIEDPSEGTMIFHTKGDNNTSEDSQTVKPDDVKGIYLRDIPKIGYPTLLLKGVSTDPIKEDVEF